MNFYNDLIAPILQNQIATGLSLTAVVGGTIYQLKQVPSALSEYAKRQTLVRLRVYSSDSAFRWIEHWLAEQPFSKTTRSVMLKARDTGSFGNDFYHGDADPNLSTWELSPGTGLHTFKWRGKRVWVDRSTGENAIANGKKREETIHIWTVGRSQKVLRDIVTEALQLSQLKETVSIKLWRDGYWTNVNGKLPRPLSTVILKRGLKEQLLADMERFQESRQWYLSRGLPWRRGYLLSGPPGCGKTSFVLALAGHFNKSIHVLNLGSVENDNDLFSAVIQAPTDAIILIEDIDCAESAGSREVEKDDSSDKKETKGITKAGLLNAIDGVTTPDGRIFVMTTNYPERLDKALVRPGRADVSAVLGYLDEAEQLELASLYYADGFVPLERGVAPAELIKAFMNYPDDPVKARELLCKN